MPVFDIVVTVKAFRKQEDDTQVQVEQLLGRADGVVAANQFAAMLVAGKRLTKVTDEILGNAVIAIKQM